MVPNLEGDIEYQDIWFRYNPSAPYLLKGLNLKIPAGSFVAIVGLSGSGKSTATKLLPRLYEPEKGKILVDNMDISKLELYSLRKQIGIVPQDTLLFDGSIHENITLTNPSASQDEIDEAVENKLFQMNLSEIYQPNMTPKLVREVQIYLEDKDNGWPLRGPYCRNQVY